MPPFISHRNRQVYVELTPLVEAALEETVLTADSAATDTTLTVKDIDGFGISDYLLIGELGTESCEVVKAHASSAPSGTTITLVTGGVEFAHSAGEKVRKIEFNQVEISHADTIGGSKSVLATSNIQGDQIKQVYTDTTETAGFYFARYKDETGSTFGSYSDGVPYGGWAENQVGFMIDQALRENKISLSNIVSLQDCLNWLNAGLQLVQGKLKRFPEHQELNYVAGQTSRGSNIVTLPTDIYDNDSNKSVIGVRVGDGEKLGYLDPLEFEDALGQVKYTQVTTQATAGGTTLEIDNSYDFNDSGSVNVYISGTKYTLTYTGVTRSASAGILTGVPASGTGSITVTIPVDTYVWQDETEGDPEFFTIRNQRLEFWPLADAKNDNENVYLDYFKVVTFVDSLGDTIDSERYEMLLDYLTWRIRMKFKFDGKLDQNDGYYVQFKERLNDFIRTLVSPFTYKQKPRPNRISYKYPFGRKITRKDRWET